MADSSGDGKALRRVVLGSRGSALALVQTRHVQALLQARHPDTELPIVTMVTQGDKILDVALSKIGSKGLFTKELEQALLRREIDLAVHSLKDLPTRLPEGLTIGAILEREECSDALVLSPARYGLTLDTLPTGAVIGTSSLRRIAQLRHHYPHLAFKDMRGNIQTRLKRLDDPSNGYDALILAAVGLQRLNLHERISQVIPQHISMPAVGQGALAIECRANDEAVLSFLAPLLHLSTAVRCVAERTFLRALEGGCQVPIGVISQIFDTTSSMGEAPTSSDALDADASLDSSADSDLDPVQRALLESQAKAATAEFCRTHVLRLDGIVLSEDGTKVARGYVEGTAENCRRLGLRLARLVSKEGAREILEEIIRRHRPKELVDKSLV